VYDFSPFSAAGKTQDKQLHLLVLQDVDLTLFLQFGYIGNRPACLSLGEQEEQVLFEMDQNLL